MDRAQWFRAWQEKLRYDEAVNIWCADFRATIRGYDHMARLWLAAASRDGVPPGERAYAHQHHTLFTRMRDECQVQYDKARAPGVAADTLDQTMVRRAWYLLDGVALTAALHSLSGMPCVHKYRETWWQWRHGSQ